MNEDRITRALRSVGDRYLNENPSDFEAFRSGIAQRRRGRRLLMGFGTAAVTAAAVIAFLWVGGTPPADDGLPITGAEGLELVTDAALGGLGHEVASIGDEAWVSVGDSVVQVLSGGAAPVTTVDLPGTPGDVLQGSSGVWVSVPEADLLVNIDPATAEPTELSLAPEFTNPTRMHVGEFALRVIVDQGVVRIPLDTLEPQLLYSGSVVDSALGAHGFWLLLNDGTITAIDPDGGNDLEGLEDVHEVPGGIEITYLREALWYATSGGTKLIRFDEATGAETNEITLPGGYVDIDAGEAGLWVLLRQDKGGSMLELDPATGEAIGAPYIFDSAPSDLSANESGIWVVLGNNNTLQLTTP